MASKAQKFIVLGTLAEHANVLFLMREDDFRFGNPEYGYKTVCGGRLTAVSLPAPNGRRMKQFRGDNGHNYGVFADGSVKMLSE